MADRYHHGNLRAAFLDAALVALQDGGSQDLSLRALAIQIGVSVNAVYRHFASKDALMLELTAIGFDRLRERLEQAAQKRDKSSQPVRLRSVGIAYVQFARDEPALFRLMFARGACCTRSGGRLPEASAGAFGVLMRSMAAVRGDAPEASATLKASVAAWALVHGYAVLAMEGCLDGIPDAGQLQVQELVQMLDPRGRLDP